MYEVIKMAATHKREIAIWVLSSTWPSSANISSSTLSMRETCVIINNYELLSATSRPLPFFICSLVIIWSGEFLKSLIMTTWYVLLLVARSGDLKLLKQNCALFGALKKNLQSHFASSANSAVFRGNFAGFRSHFARFGSNFAGFENNYAGFCRNSARF